jgi:hypothetical protein
MNSGMAFKKEEKLSVSKIASILLDVKDSVFTICFQKKLDDKLVSEKLQKFKKNMTDKALK